MTFRELYLKNLCWDLSKFLTVESREFNVFFEMLPNDILVKYPNKKVILFGMDFVVLGVD